MQQGSWHDDDTDSEHGGDLAGHLGNLSPGSSSSGGGAAVGGAFSGPLDNAAVAPAEALTQEEFGRLQDEILALKMHNEELLAERRRLQATAALVPATALPGPAPPAAAVTEAQKMYNKLPSAASLSNSFSNRMKAASQGVASLQSTFKKSATGDGGLPLSALAALQSPPGTDDEAAAAHDEMSALRVEGEYLRSRIKATLEEKEEFEVVTSDAQQVLAAEERAAGAAPPSLPRAAELQQQLQERSIPEAEALDEALLLRVARAAIVLAHGDCHEEPKAPAAAEEAACAPAEEDEDMKLLNGKIHAQQQELDRLLEVFHQQQAQIIRYRDQISGREDARQKELKQKLKEKLHEAEQQVEVLQRQLDASEQVSRQSRELRLELRALAEQAVQRDEVLAEMRSVHEAQAEEVALQRERLHFMQEDLLAWGARRAEDQALHAPPSPQRAASSTGGSPSRRRRMMEWSPNSARDPISPGSATSRGRAPPAFAEAEMQVSDATGGLAELEERQRLGSELEDLRIERSLLEKRVARELRELRSLVSTNSQASSTPVKETASACPQPPAAPKAASPPKEGAVHHDISSDGEDVPTLTVASDDEEEPVEPPAELRYVQRVAELEQRNERLREHLARLHKAEDSLRTQNKEKNDLIAHLAQRANVLKGGGVAKASGRSRDLKEDVKELERVVEETTTDNIRLRNDIQIMADELRKILPPVKLRR